MSRWIALVALTVVAPLSVGCSTLPRAGSIDTSSSDEPLLIEGNVPASSNVSYAGLHAAPPDQVDVGWTDNGQTIRELSPGDAPRAVAPPPSRTKKRGALVVSEAGGAREVAKTSK